MNKINWLVRFKNPVFIIQILMAIILPILTYNGLQLSDVTTWDSVGELLLGAIKNPFLLGTVAWGVFNAITDPTTKGIADSENALTYKQPK